MPKIKDPRTEISFFRDEIPILMMPVRLETRFRQGPAPELLVRVYPDDCSIDSFEPELSASEIDSARKYWLAVYAAGLFPDQERGAWRALAGAYGSGRAQFILENFQPLDPPPTTRPKKSRPEDLLLTIATDAAPSSTEADALLAYWTAAWRAQGRAKELELARSTLVGVVGGDKQADALLDRYTPSNFRTKGAAGIGVETIFVVFPPAGKAKTRSWSRAATAELMPDVFVFIGINGGVEEVVELGEPVITPLVVSPDPSAPEALQLRHDKDGSLIFPDEMLWMVDFDRAVKSGMGFRIRLTPAQASRGFERVLVVGIRGSDEKLAATELETLIAHQRSSRAGYAVIPQGTPTNNTDGGSSGWSRTDDPDESFDAMRTDRLFTDTPVWLDKADGQWLTELLGLSGSAFGKVANSDGRDQADARAMNAALWPATMGYWMHTMMSPIFDDATTASTREFFTNFVLGRGALPAVRIGNQPYGILPATAYSRMLWPSPSEGGGVGGTKFLDGLYRLIRAMDNDWKSMAGSVSFSGKPGDPHKILLDILGLHAGSVEFTQRYAESTEQLYNRLSIDGLGPLVSLLIVAGLVKRATDQLATFGYTGTPPDIVRK
ncbi:MAG: hypothetical protein JOZ54_16485, partial [Acidobacteria bacterium]|nr:hypothetical protein [Acidobacteriota bacterium]